MHQTYDGGDRIMLWGCVIQPHNMRLHAMGHANPLSCNGVKYKTVSV